MIDQKIVHQGLEMYWIRCLFFAFCLHPFLASAQLQIGVAEIEITPPVGAPSAGYADRKGQGMEGVHDPLLATAMVVDDGQTLVAFCGIDHLGIDTTMMQEIRSRIQANEHLKRAKIFVGSSHTHSGPGGYLDIPGLGEWLAGPFSAQERERTIHGVVKAVTIAAAKLQPGKLGVGYAEVEQVSRYRGVYPKTAPPRTTVTVIKAENTQGKPIAVFFNYALHPTVLKGSNRLFSADFVGYSRQELKKQLGEECVAIYFNGAQGDVIPATFHDKQGFTAAEEIGQRLAESVLEEWRNIPTKTTGHFTVLHSPYALEVQPTAQEITLPIDEWPTEINLILWDNKHAFLTIPGELSCVYDRQLRSCARSLGFCDLSILGLTNDAHGYIILPGAWEIDCTEARLSFGGRLYGEKVRHRAESLLYEASPLRIDDVECWQAFPTHYPSCFSYSTAAIVLEKVQTK